MIEKITIATMAVLTGSTLALKKNFNELYDINMQTGQTDKTEQVYDLYQQDHETYPLTKTLSRLEQYATQARNYIDGVVSNNILQRGVTVTYLDQSGDFAAPGLAQFLKNVGQKVADEGDSYEAVVDNIIKAAKGHKIRHLRMYAHGTEGLHGLSWSANIDLTLTDSVQSTRMLSHFSRLKEHLHDDAQIILFGCNVAEGKKGTKLLKELAKATGATVSAGEGLQIPEPGRLDGVHKVTGFDKNGDLQIYRLRSEEDIAEAIARLAAENWYGYRLGSESARHEDRSYAKDSNIEKDFRDRFGVSLDSLDSNPGWIQFINSLDRGSFTSSEDIQWAQDRLTAILGQHKGHLTTTEFKIAKRIILNLSKQDLANWHEREFLEQFNGTLKDHSYPARDLNPLQKTQLQNLLCNQLRS